MGTATPPPPVIGDACNLCDNILWTPGSTPQFIHVEFKDLVFCGGSPLSAPNAIWVLDQHPVLPCRWVYEGALFGVVVELGVGQTEVGCVGRGVGAGWFFFAGSGNACESDFNNIYLLCIANIGSALGTAHITWS